jgi:hypothetical protein
MPPKAKIPPILRDEVLQRSGRGETSSAIAAFLFAEYSVEVDPSSVRRMVIRDKHDRADVSREVAREELRKRLLPAIRRLGNSARTAEAIERRHRKLAAELRAKDPASVAAVKYEGLALKARGSAIQAAEALLRYGGLDAPDHSATGATGTAQERRAKLLRRLEEICKPAVAKDPAAVQ